MPEAKLIRAKNALPQKKRLIMKKQSYTTIAMVVLLGCLAVSARAQCSSTQLSADIPFQFNVGKTTLPPGEYKVTCLNSEIGPLVIRSEDHKVIVTVTTNAVTGIAQDHGKLVFHRYGAKYFFAQAWAGGLETGAECPESRTERMAARELAGMKAKRQEIALKARP